MFVFFWSFLWCYISSKISIHNSNHYCFHFHTITDLCRLFQHWWERNRDLIIQKNKNRIIRNNQIPLQLTHSLIWYIDKTIKSILYKFESIALMHHTNWPIIKQKQVHQLRTYLSLYYKCNLQCKANLLIFFFISTFFMSIWSSLQ